MSASAPTLETCPAWHRPCWIISGNAHGSGIGVIASVIAVILIVLFGDVFPSGH